MPEHITFEKNFPKDHVSEVVAGTVFMLNADKVSIIEVLRVGIVHDRGFKITEAMLDDYIKNFDDEIYGTQVQVNLGHYREGEAAGWIRRLFKEGERLLAEVEWTPLGQEKIATQQYKFTSAELALTYPHWKTGDKVKNVLIGVALTNIPAVKGLQPVRLSEQVQLFLKQHSMKKLKKLYDTLFAKDSITKAEFDSFAEAADKVEGEDEQKEAADMKDKLEDKVEEPEKKEEEPEKKEEAPAEEGKTDLKDKPKYVSLTEFEKEKEKNLKLQEKIERMELNELVEAQYTFSEDIQTGFVPEAKDKLVDFLLSLTTAQREQFAELFTKIQTVDLSVRGSSAAKGKKEFSEEAVVELAEKKLQEAKEKGVELSVAEAQKAAMKELQG